MASHLELVRSLRPGSAFYGWIGTLAGRTIDYFGHRKSLNNAGQALIERKQQDLDNRILACSLQLSPRALEAMPVELKQQTLQTEAADRAQLPRLLAVRRRFSEVPAGSEAHLAPMLTQLYEHVVGPNTHQHHNPPQKQAQQ